MALFHKRGHGRVTITGIGHETYKGVAEWFFIGDVDWQDSPKSEGIEISPIMVCYDSDDPASKVELDAAMKRLNDYLAEQGEWHDAKHKRDGRVYSWTPKQPKHRIAI